MNGTCGLCGGPLTTGGYAHTDSCVLGSTTPVGFETVQLPSPIEQRVEIAITALLDILKILAAGDDKESFTHLYFRVVDDLEKIK